MLTPKHMRMIIANIEEFKRNFIYKYYCYINNIGNREHFNNDELEKLHSLGFNLNGVFIGSNTVNERFYAMGFDRANLMVSESKKYIRKIYKGINTHFLNEVYMYTLFAKYGIQEMAPTLVEVGYDCGNYYITLEYIPNHYQLGCFTINNLLDFLNKIYIIHYLGITHNDIKPENLILDGLGQIRLIDFEYCKVSYPFVNSDKLTTMNKYTPLYAPIERIGAREIIQYKFTYRSDIWAAGVSIIETYLGIDIFQKCRNISQLKKAVNEFINKEYLTTKLIPENPDFGELLFNMFYDNLNMENVIKQVIQLECR